MADRDSNLEVCTTLLSSIFSLYLKFLSLDIISFFLRNMKIFLSLESHSGTPYFFFFWELVGFKMGVMGDS